MVQKAQVCEECAQRCLQVHGRKTHPRTTLSFFKIMMESTLRGPLYLPPQFASSAQNMTDELSNLEDASGQRWRVKISVVDGALAFENGWRKFVLDHGLKFGELLLFTYIVDSHFLVKIYGTSACEKLNFLYSESENCEKGKEVGKEDAVESVHSKSTVEKLNCSTRTSEVPKKRTRDSQLEVTQVSQEHTASRRSARLSNNVNDQGHLDRNTEKMKTAKKMRPSLLPCSAPKDAGLSIADRVLRSSRRSGSMSKPHSDRMPGASKEPHQQQNVDANGVILIDCDFDDADPGSTEKPSKYACRSKKISNVLKKPVNGQSSQSPKETRNVRGESMPCSMPEKVDAESVLLDGFGNGDSSVHFESRKTAACSEPKIPLVFTSSVAGDTDQMPNATGRTSCRSSLRRASEILKEQVNGVTDEVYGVNGPVKRQSDSNSPSITTESKYGSENMDKEPILIKEDSLCRNLSGKICDSLEMPDSILAYNSVNVEAASEQTVVFTKPPECKIGDNYDTKDMGDLPGVERSPSCHGTVESTFDDWGKSECVKEISENTATTIKTEVLQSCSSPFKKNGKEQKVDDLQCSRCAEDSLIAAGDIRGRESSGEVLHAKLSTLQSHNDGHFNYAHSHRRSLDELEDLQHQNIGDPMDAGIFTVSTKDEECLSKNFKDCEQIEYPCPVIDKGGTGTRSGAACTISSSEVRERNHESEKVKCVPKMEVASVADHGIGKSSSSTRYAIESGKQTEQSAHEGAKACEVFGVSEFVNRGAAGNGITSYVSMLSLMEKGCCIKDVNGRPPAFTQGLYMGGAILGSVSASTVPMTDIPVALCPPGMGDVIKVRAQIEETSYGSTGACEAAKVHSFVINGDSSNDRTIKSGITPNGWMLKARDRRYNLEYNDDLDFCAENLGRADLWQGAIAVEAVNMADQGFVESASGSSLTCEALKVPYVMRARDSVSNGAATNGTVPGASMVEAVGRRCVTEGLNGVLQTDKQDLDHFGLEADFANADIGNQDSGCPPLIAEDVNKLKSSSKEAAYGSSRDCKALGVPGSGIGENFMNESPVLNGIAPDMSMSEGRGQGRRTSCINALHKTEERDLFCEESLACGLVQKGSEASHMEDQGKEGRLVSELTPEEPSKVKTGERLDSDDGPSPACYECLVSVKSLFHLELPANFPQPKRRGASSDKLIIVIRDSTMRLWPVIFQEFKTSQKMLLTGWEHLAAANDIVEGDACVLKVINEAVDMFEVHISKQPHEC